MYNELYNAVLPSKNQQTSNNFLNNFSIEYDIIQGLKLKANLSLSVDNGKTDVYKSYENTEFLDKEKKGVMPSRLPMISVMILTSSYHILRA